MTPQEFRVVKPGIVAMAQSAYMSGAWKAKNPREGQQRIDNLLRSIERAPTIESAVNEARRFFNLPPKASK